MGILFILALLIAMVLVPARMFYQDWKTRRALARLIRAGFLEGPDK